MNARSFLPPLLAAFLLLSAGGFLLNNLASFNASQPSEDPASAWDARMRTVAEALPSDVSSVGYLDGADLDPSIPGREQAEFYLTQYGLAPTVVHMGADYDWVVGNFGNAVAPAEIRSALQRKLGSYDLQDLGFGIYLIHRLSR